MHRQFLRHNLNIFSSSMFIFLEKDIIYHVESCSMKKKLKKKKAIEVNGIRKETRNLLFPEISFLN